MKCPNCDKKLTDERINTVILRYGNVEREHRSSHKIYCNNSCFREYRSKQSVELRTCKECGEVRRHIHTNIHGIARCTDCSEMSVSARRLDSEIKELIVLNPGAGFSYFIDKVFKQDGRRCGSKHHLRSKLTMFLLDLSEIEGADYLGWLQNPDTMRVVKQDKVPPELEMYIRGQRRSSVSSHVQHNKIKLGKMTAEDAQFNTFVKIPPEFRWGKYKPL